MSERIFVVVPCFNRKDVTLTCLEYLAAQTRGPDLVVVADGGSSDGTPEAVLAAHPNTVVLRAPEEYWWAGSMAQGIDHVLSLTPDDDDLLLMMNDDTVLPPDYIEVMARVCRREWAAVGAVVVDAERPSLVLSAGVNIDWPRYGFPVRKDPPPPGTLREVDVLPGRGSILPIAMIRAAGNVDYRHFPHYVADYDFFLRVAKAGFRLGVTGDTWIASHTKMTGIVASARPTGWKAAWQQAFSRRSMVNLGDHCRFVLRHAPGWALKLRLVTMIVRHRLKMMFDFRRDQ